MLMSHDIIRSLSADKVNDVVGTEVLLDHLNSLQHNQQRLLGLNLGLGMQTVVAVLTIVLRIFLTEVMEQHLTATNR